MYELVIVSYRTSSAEKGDGRPIDCNPISLGVPSKDVFDEKLEESPFHLSL